MSIQNKQPEIPIAQIYPALASVQYVQVPQQYVSATRTTIFSCHVGALRSNFKNLPVVYYQHVARNSYPPRGQTVQKKVT